MLLFVMRLLVLKKNLLKQKKKDGELASFCVQNHILVSDLVLLLWGFFSSGISVHYTAHGLVTE